MVLGQAGYNRTDILDIHIQPDINDVVYQAGKLLLSTNGFNESIQRWTQHLVALDTFGNILNDSELMDTVFLNHLVSNTPTHFTTISGGGAVSTVHYFGRATIGVAQWNGDMELQYLRELPRIELIMFPTEIRELHKEFYISGYIQRLNYDLDVFLVKVTWNGDFQWIKMFGLPNEDDVAYGMYVDQEGLITIGCKSEPYNWSAHPPFNDYWRQPWTITIDTSGQVIREWRGEKAHTDEMSAYGLARPWDGSYGIFYNEFHEVQPGKILYRLTTALLDSTMQIRWKRHYGDLTLTGSFRDIGYSAMDSTIVVAGDIGWDNQLRGLIVKYDMEGNELWSVRPTGIAEHPAVRHYMAGLDIAPSGSIYAAGYIEDARAGSSRTKYGWLMKVTPDGCIDTLCATTSIEEQIASRQGWQVVFPNPVRDEIRIILPEADPQPMTMVVYDMQGRIVDRIQVTDRQQSFKVDWQPGMYGYQLLHKGVPVYVGKLVKME
jgi:hypothetical protein